MNQHDERRQSQEREHTADDWSLAGQSYPFNGNGTARLVFHAILDGVEAWHGLVLHLESRKTGHFKKGGSFAPPPIMDKLVKPDVNELQLTFNNAQNGCSSSFTLTNLMHTMSAAVCLTTSNPSIFSISQPFSLIPPLSSFSYTMISLSDEPPLTYPPNTITVRSSMLPIGKPHPDDLPSLFSKYRPHVFQDATIPISFVGPYVVEYLMHLRHIPLPQLSFHIKKAVSGCTRSQLSTFLITAVSSGKSDFVLPLIDAGADINVKDSSGLSLLSVAVQAGTVDVVKALIASDCPIDNSVDLVFHFAAAINRVDLFEVLSSNKKLREMDVDSDGRTPIHIAAVHGHVEMIRFCVSIGGNPEARDGNGWTPLHCAAVEGHLEAVQCLLECSNVKYVMTNDGKTAFGVAVDNGHSHLFQVLHLGDVLQRAARVDDVHGLKSCLAAGAKVNDTDQNGWTPLHRAAFKGRIECAKLLLEFGAEVDVVNDSGRTPLHCAVETGHLQVALMLIANGANAHAKDFNLFTKSVSKPKCSTA